MTTKTPTRIKSKLRKGDHVIVLTGKCRSQTGDIERLDLKNNKMYITGLNLAKKHTKPSLSNEQGGIVDKAMPIHASNVALVDPKTKKPTKVGYKVEEGRKVRFAKASGTQL